MSNINKLHRPYTHPPPLAACRLVQSSMQHKDTWTCTKQEIQLHVMDVYCTGRGHLFNSALHSLIFHVLWCGTLVRKIWRLFLSLGIPYNRQNCTHVKFVCMSNSFMWAFHATFAFTMTMMFFYNKLTMSCCQFWGINTLLISEKWLFMDSCSLLLLLAMLSNN